MRYWIEVMQGAERMLGSDGTVPLDGRLSFASAIDQGYAYCERLRGVKPRLTGFTLARGEKPSTFGHRSRVFEMRHAD